jgi:putative hydrolase of the HAD superfamily
MTALPRAILFDLDDTILSAYARPHLAWAKIAVLFAAELAPLDPGLVAAAITAAGELFWSDSARHKYWRQRPVEARLTIVEAGFAELARAGHPMLPRDLAERMAARFTALREEEMHLFPGAIDTLCRLGEAGVRMALVTNGPAEVQRAKILRFALERHFVHIQIEGEHGFGKPEERAYTHAMTTLGVTPAETWMVGDNLEWEVAAPQRLGIYAIWHDAHGAGLPKASPVRPDRIIRSLAELV